jgi:hypothetical protein
MDLSIFVSASSDDEHKKMNETKATKVAKKRLSKEKSNEPKKLKRIQKSLF